MERIWSGIPAPFLAKNREIKKNGRSMENPKRPKALILLEPASGVEPLT